MSRWKRIFLPFAAMLLASTSLTSCAFTKLDQSKDGFDPDDANDSPNDSPDNNYECGFENGDSNCDICITTRCCDKALTCANNPDCNILNECMNNCGIDEYCMNGCGDQHAMGIFDLNQLYECLDNMCFDECFFDDLK